MKVGRCNQCNYVGVRTSFIDRNGFMYFLDKSMKAVEDYYIILESKMNIPETFTEFKKRTYGVKNTSSAG